MFPLEKQFCPPLPPTLEHSKRDRKNFHVGRHEREQCTRESSDTLSVSRTAWNVHSPRADATEKPMAFRARETSLGNIPEAELSRRSSRQWMFLVAVPAVANARRRDVAKTSTDLSFSICKIVFARRCNDSSLEQSVPIIKYSTLIENISLRV